MISLIPEKNDTSATLDLMRAVAAQIVCVGHAINLSGAGYTYLPNVGVLLFFLLSGFLIAHTLSTKSARSDEYGLLAFGIERFSRIYTAFLPALLMIAAADVFLKSIGMPLPGDPTDLKTFLGNLTMRQGPSIPTFGSAGHLTSIAVEFHIYFFVGAMFFMLKGRNAIVCFAVALIFARIPLHYLTNIPGTDRTLFAAWLAGFAVYYIAASVTANLIVPAALGFVLSAGHWIANRSANDYDLSNYPALALAFMFLVLGTQRTHLLNASVERIIRFAADYSFSLFLVHMTIAKIVMLMPSPPLVRITLAIAASNIVAIGLAYAFERHYRRVAEHLKALLRVGSARDAAGAARTAAR